MSLSNAASAGILNQIFNGTAFSAAGAGYASLAVAGGSEVAGAGYARQLVSYGAATTANPSIATSNAEINFGTVGAGWTPLTVDELRIYSALSAGTLIYTAADSGITYVAGNRAFVASGNHTVQIGSNSIFTAAYSATILDWLVNSGSAPAQLTHAGLLNSGTEASGGNYARLAVSSLWGTATTADPSSISFSGGATNFLGGSTTATFTGAVNQIGFFTALSGGTPQVTLSVSSQTINSGDTVEINPTITLT